MYLSVRVGPALVAVAMLASSCMSAPRAAPAPAASTSSRERAAPDLAIELTRVKAFPAKGRVRPRHLRGPARGVRETMDRLYTAGFVDPAAWGEGFEPVLGEFRGDARHKATEDLERLTLGRAARRLTEVRPRRARLRVDLLVDAKKHPLAAMAWMRFAGTGMSVDGVRTPIRHRARYLLKRFASGWQVVAYRVHRRLVPEEVPGVPTKGTLFILALGSDARPGQSVARSRADSIHVIGVNLRKRKASVLGIPRDSYVSIPGVGGGKINSALFHGGPSLVVRSVERLTGVRIDGYVLTGFHGFRVMVDLIGGVKVRVPYRMSDAASGAHFRPGTRRLSGTPALAFSRNRHDAPGGDLGRSLNQGSMIVAALRELRRDVARNPLTLFRWATIAARNVETDLSLGEMLELLVAALTIDPDRVQNRVASGGSGFVGSQSVVRLGPTAAAMFRDLRRDGVFG